MKTMHPTALMLIAHFGLFACSKPPQNPPPVVSTAVISSDSSTPAPAAANQTGIPFVFAVLTNDDDQPRRVQSDDVLHSGDPIAVLVKARRPAYIYVALANSAGVSEILYPGESDSSPRMRSKLRIPEHGDWLELDESVGTESFFAITSPRPLSSEEVRALLPKPIASDKAGAPKPAPASAPPKRATTRFTRQRPRHSSPGLLSSSGNDRSLTDAGEQAGFEEEDEEEESNRSIVKGRSPQKNPADGVRIKRLQFRHER